MMARTHLHHQGRISHISSPRLWQGPAHQRVCLVIVNRGILELREELLDLLHNCHLLLQDGDGATCTLSQHIPHSVQAQLKGGREDGVLLWGYAQWRGGGEEESHVYCFEDSWQHPVCYRTRKGPT